MLATVVVTVLSVMVPAAPTAATTTPKVKGGVVTIQVRVDVIGAKGQKGPDGQPLVKYWEQIIDDTWADAFDRMPYKNCYRLKLKLKLKARGRNAAARDGWHVIHVTGESPGGWRGAGWEGVPETSRRPATGDGTRSFEHGRDGTIPVNAPPTIVAHEFGHLFGLGDDRKGGKAKPGREGTLMVGGVPGVDPDQPQRIDQDLIDRIGDAIRKHLQNEGKKLPKCETWSGTFRSSNTGSSCTGSAEGDIRLAVAGAEVTGTIDASETQSCPPVGGYTYSGSFAFTGTFDGEEFRLIAVGPTTEFAIASWLCIDEGPTLGVGPPGSASGEWTSSHPYDVYDCSITLEREESAPVG